LEIQTSLSVYGVLERDGLGKGHVNGLALVQAHVKLILDFLGALLSANPTANTEIFLNVPRVLDHLGLEVARLSGEAFQFGKGDKINVGVPADLDQLG
jgi:hypothetical protein